MAKKDHSNNRRKEYYCVYDAEGRRVFRGTGWSFDDAAERASRINGVPVKQLRAVLDRG